MSQYAFKKFVIVIGIVLLIAILLGSYYYFIFLPQQKRDRYDLTNKTVDEIAYMSYRSIMDDVLIPNGYEEDPVSAYGNSEVTISEDSFSNSYLSYSPSKIINLLFLMGLLDDYSPDDISEETLSLKDFIYENVNPFPRSTFKIDEEKVNDLLIDESENISEYIESIGGNTEQNQDEINSYINKIINDAGLYGNFETKYHSQNVESVCYPLIYREYLSSEDTDLFEEVCTDSYLAYYPFENNSSWCPEEQLTKSILLDIYNLYKSDNYDELKKIFNSQVDEGGNISAYYNPDLAKDLFILADTYPESAECYRSKAYEILQVFLSKYYYDNGKLDQVSNIGLSQILSLFSYLIHSGELNNEYQEMYKGFEDMYLDFEGMSESVFSTSSEVEMWRVYLLESLILDKNLKVYIPGVSAQEEKIQIDFIKVFDQDLIEKEMPMLVYDENGYGSSNTTVRLLFNLLVLSYMQKND